MQGPVHLVSNLGVLGLEIDQRYRPFLYGCPPFKGSGSGLRKRAFKERSALLPGPRATIHVGLGETFLHGTNTSRRFIDPCFPDSPRLQVGRHPSWTGSSPREPR